MKTHTIYFGIRVKGLIAWALVVRGSLCTTFIKCIRIEIVYAEPYLHKRFDLENYILSLTYVVLS